MTTRMPKQIGSYRIKTSLFKSNTCEYALGIHEGQQPVLLRWLPAIQTSAQQLERWNEELQLLKSIDCSSTLKPLELGLENDYLFMSFKHQAVDTLWSDLDFSRFTLSDTLALFIRLVEALAPLHRSGIFLHAFTPRSIALDKDLQQLVILDFELAQFAPKPTAREALPIYEYQLPYLSPEQTGMLPTLGDLRSDLYMLGCIFFENLFKRPVFAAQDARAWLNAHISQKIVLSPEEEKNGFPPLLKVVYKLLEKDPRLRYQSVAGLKQDLEYCLQHLYDPAPPMDFIPGLKDVTPELNLDLYPLRESGLLDLFHADLQRPGAEVWMLEGPRGVGKSRLIQSCAFSAAPTILLKGSFSPNNQHIPYHGWKEAFEQLAERLLQEDQPSLVKWTRQLLHNHPASARILGDWIPSFRLSLTAVEEEPNVLPSRDARIRFFSVIRELLNAIAQERPLLIVLDDVHHADSASLELLENLLQEPQFPPCKLCLCVESYASNGQFPRMLSHSTVPFKRVQLPRLSDEEVRQWLDHTMGSTQKGLQELAQILNHKTQGIARSLVQTLLLHQQNRDIRYNFGYCCWEWNLDAILHPPLATASPLDLNTLSETARCGLQRIALLQRHAFREKDLEFLFTGEDNPQAILRQARAMGYLEISNEDLAQPQLQYRIVPGPFWDVVKHQTPHSSATAIHREIIAWYSREDHAENLTRISDHYELLGIDNWTPEEQAKAFQLNVACGRAALHSYAFHIADIYFSRALRHLPPQSWSNDYAATLPLFEDAASVKLHTGAYVEVLALLETIFKNIRRVEDKAIAVELQMETWKLRNDLHTAIECGLAYLRELGLVIPGNPSLVKSNFQFMAVLWTFLTTRNVTILSMKKASDPIALAKTKILIALGTLVYLGRPPLVREIMRETLKLVFKHGHFDHSAYWFANLGMVLRGHLKWDSASNRAAHLAEKLLSTQDYPHIRAKTLFSLNFFINHWQKPLHQTVSAGRQSLDLAWQTNDYEFAAYSMLLISSHALDAGFYLDQIRSELEQFIGRTASIYQIPQLNLLKIYRQYFKSLIQTDEEDAFEPIEEQPEWYRDRTAVALRYLLELESLYFFRDYTQARVVAKRRAPLQDTGLSTVYHTKFILLKNLTLLAECLEKNSKLSLFNYLSVWWSTVLFRRWSRTAPENYAAKYSFLRAEFHRYRGQLEQANACYEQTIDRSTRNNCLWLQALAWERLGQWSEQKQNLSMAQVQLQKARELWKEWGAENKVKQIEHNLATIQLSQTGIHTTDNELGAILQTASTIVGALRYEELLSKLLRLLIEEFGAQEGLIARVVDQQVSTELEAFYEGTELVCQQPQQKERVKQYLPFTLLQNLLDQKKQQVIRRTAEQDAIRGREADALPAALFAYPIVSRNQVIGLIFLVHHQLNNVFQERNLKKMELLAGQLGVSFQNALLYREMELEIKKRTETIERINQEMLAKNLQLEQQIELEKKLNAQKNELNELKIQAIEQENQVRLATNEILTQELARKVIAEDLHDNVKSSLTAVSLQLAVLNSAPIVEAHKESVTKARRSLKEAQDELYRIMHNLSPMVLHDRGLNTAIQQLCDDWTTEAFQIVYHSNLADTRFDSKIEISLYTICKELLANANKHAQASLIEVEMKHDEEEGQLCLQVKDNGIGFNKDKKVRKGALGMSSIRSRVTFINGAIKIDSAPGKGTSVQVISPVE